MAQKKKKINRDVQITKLKASVKQLEKDVKEIRKAVTETQTNPYQAMLVALGTAAPGSKEWTLTKTGIGVSYARSLKEAGEIDKLKELGVSDKEIERL